MAGTKDGVGKHLPAESGVDLQGADHGHLPKQKAPRWKSGHSDGYDISCFYLRRSSSQVYKCPMFFFMGNEWTFWLAVQTLVSQ